STWRAACSRTLGIQEVNDLPRQLLWPHTATRQGVAGGADQMAWGEGSHPLAMHQTASPSTNCLFVFPPKRQDVSQCVLGKITAGLKRNLVHHLGDYSIGAGQQAGRQSVKTLRGVQGLPDPPAPACL